MEAAEAGEEEAAAAAGSGRGAQALVRVKGGRHSRENGLRAPSGGGGGAKRRKQSQQAQPCPVCGGPLSGSLHERSQHVNACLSRQGCMAENRGGGGSGSGGGGREELKVCVDGSSSEEESFEEYEWCGETRVRASSLLVGGYRGSGFVTNSGVCQESEGELDVEGDQSLQFGSPQYSEADVVPCDEDGQGDALERQALRGALINGDVPCARLSGEPPKWERPEDDIPSTSSAAGSSEKSRTQRNSDIHRPGSSSSGVMIQALKARVQELERLVERGDRYHCLICMEPYTQPLVSVQCWHVHCEECWLRSLGAKKLCPRCNAITSPRDLRRVYL
ncbi:E3 ubiquitin-protein ligase Rnf220-like isoform X1 [Petromyzon marinus]|uniref:E3 ubiquitin-protein ligase Rnf220-like isoform X1 n=1 Tax=Petromyzon marinus TaxID=7757 RepID=A0AAJ7T362_PETMA|nr:E3 ubiquitin-protein ligase Rnf220-like isoform X1 [Petromyzon marinus]